jgi:hypothetical protein
VRRPAITVLGDFADEEAIFYLNQVVRDGEDPTHWFNWDDARIARETIQRIVRRV